MRTCLKALLLLGFSGILVAEAAPPVLAADLGVTRAKRVSVRVIHHHRLRVVRDYDGTPIVLRRLRPVVRDDDGNVRVLAPRTEAQAVVRPQPHYYLNGQPVRPTQRLLYRARQLVYAAR